MSSAKWRSSCLSLDVLTHWGRVTYICGGKLTIIGSDNGLSPAWCQAIIWTNAGILLIGPLGTNFSEILIEIQTFSLKKIRLKMSSAKCCSFRFSLNVLSCPWPQASQRSLTSALLTWDNVAADAWRLYWKVMFWKLTCFKMVSHWAIIHVWWGLYLQGK